jgi:hypothetical protein
MPTPRSKQINRDRKGLIEDKDSVQKGLEVSNREKWGNAPNQKGGECTQSMLIKTRFLIKRVECTFRKEYNSFSHIKISLYKKLIQT